MIRMLVVFVLGAVFVFGQTAETAAKQKDPSEKKETEKDDSYIKLEAKGKLVTGIRAPGGDTTGVMIRTAVGSFELELDKEQKKLSDKLSDKTVIVTGMLLLKAGLKGGPRTLIRVSSLKEA